MRSASEDERPWVSFAFQGEFVGGQREGRWLMMSATAALQQNDGAVGGHSVDAPRPVPGRDALRHLSRACVNNPAAFEEAPLAHESSTRRCAR